MIPNPTLEFCIEFLHTIEEFKNVELPANTVLETLRSKFSNDPKCIEFLAQRHLEKDHDSAAALQEYEQALEVRSSCTQALLWSIKKTQHSFTLILQRDSWPGIWEAYAEFCLYLLSVTDSDSNTHLEQYIDICERALKAEKATEALLVRWVGVLNGLSKWAEAREKAEILTTLHATSPSAWLTRIGLLHEQNFAGNYHPAKVA